MGFSANLINSVWQAFDKNGGVTGGLAKELVERFQQNDGGGLAAMLEQLRSKGLSAAVESWVGTGPNQEVTPDQMGQAMDKNVLEQLAARLGISPQIAAAHLAEMLPKIVDRLTPDGRLPADVRETAATTSAS